MADWLAAMMATYEGADGARQLVPVLRPSSWSGSHGNECSRRLFRTDAQTDEDPWVTLAFVATDGDGVETLPPGGLATIGRQLGAEPTQREAEALACALLHRQIRPDALQVTPVGDKPDEVFRLRYKGLGASLILLPPVLSAVQTNFGAELLFVGVPTGDAVIVTGAPARAPSLFALVEAEREAADETSHLSRAVFLTRDGVVFGMGREAFVADPPPEPS